MRAILRGIVGLVVISGLSACDHFLPDPLAFTVVEGQPIVRVCIPLEVTEIQIKMYAEEQDHNGTIVWQATGSMDVAAAGEFALGVLPEGFTLTRDLGAAWLDARAFSVILDVRSARGGRWTTFSYFDPTALVSGAWLDGAAQPVDVPCSQEDCAPGYACFNDWPDPTGDPTLPAPTFSPKPQTTG